MREVRLVWTRGYEQRAAVERVLSSAGVDPIEGDWANALGIYGWQGKFDIDDPRWRVLRAKAQAAGHEPLIAGHTEYTEEEKCTAELLFVETVLDFQSKGETGPDNGNEYNYSEACPVCLSGAKLIPPFRISARDLPKRRSIAQTYRREFLVSEELAADLQAVTGTDDWLVPVEDKQSRQPLPWLAIQPSATMPRLLPSTRGFIHDTADRPTGSCRQCGRDCWGGAAWHVDQEGVEIVDPMVLAYSRNEVSEACGNWIRPGDSVPDIAGMWELYGPGTRPGISVKRQVAQPYTLVSQRVARVLREHVGKWMNLTPVFLID